MAAIAAYGAGMKIASPKGGRLSAGSLNLPAYAAYLAKFNDSWSLTRSKLQRLRGDLRRNRRSLLKKILGEFGIVATFAGIGSLSHMFPDDPKTLFLALGLEGTRLPCRCVTNGFGIRQQLKRTRLTSSVS